MKIFIITNIFLTIILNIECINQASGNLHKLFLSIIQHFNIFDNKLSSKKVSIT
jgi:hypothetical protein